jgi:hypothetical protein
MWTMEISEQKKYGRKGDEQMSKAVRSESAQN